MEWILDIKGANYEVLLKVLFTHCDTVQCIMIGDGNLDDYFQEIQYELIEEKFVTAWPLTNLGQDAVPVLQFSFHCNYLTQQFFLHRQTSLFSWIMPEPEDLSFWKDGICVFATCSHEQFVYIEPSFQQLSVGFKEKILRSIR